MVRLDDRVLEIEAPAGFYFDYLSRPDHVSDIEALAQQHLSRNFKLLVNQQMHTPVVAVDPSKERESNEAAAREAALGNPVVQAAVEILGGEVHDVRARRARHREAK